MGQFEHMLDLAELSEIHWFWSSMVPYVPHHMWWATIGVYILYLILSLKDFRNEIETLISIFNEYENQVNNDVS